MRNAVCCCKSISTRNGFSSCANKVVAKQNETQNPRAALTLFSTPAEAKSSGERVKFVRCAISILSANDPPELLLLGHNLRSCFHQLDLRADFLKRRCLRLQLRRQSVDLLLLLLDLSMFFDELVQQHRVDRFVSDRINLSFAVARHQIGIYFG